MAASSMSPVLIRKRRSTSSKSNRPWLISAAMTTIHEIVERLRKEEEALDRMSSLTQGIVESAQDDDTASRRPPSTPRLSAAA